MKIHPYANLFPMQSDEEIQLLADDIAKHGLRQPIIIDKDEQILDGRNRSAACAIAQVKPLCEPFVGTEAELLAYVVSVNVHRRHLSTSQRAEIAAKIADMTFGANQHSGKKKKEGGSNDPPSKPVSTKQAAKLMNVSTASVKRAKAAAKPAKEVKAAVAAVEPAKEIRPKEPAEKKPPTVVRIERTLINLGKDKKRHPQLIQIVNTALRQLTDEDRCGVLSGQLLRLSPEDRDKVYANVQAGQQASGK